MWLWISFVYLIGGFFLLILFLGIFIIIKFSKKKRISDEKISFFKVKINQIKAFNSWKEQIIDYDKLYHKILQELGYSGDFGSILKQNPSVISDINKVWELHKLRNKLVHDFDLVTENVLRKKALQYEELIKQLLK